MNMNLRIINYAEVEEAIKNVETVLDIYDEDERFLILNYVKKRILANQQKRKVKETVEGNPIYKMANKFMKKGDE